MENPILYRAARQARRQTLSQRLGLRLLYPSILLLPTAILFLGSTGCGMSDAIETGFAVSAFLTLAMFPLRALAGTVSAFARERELRTLEPLLASRLTPRDLLVGKLASCVIPLLAEGLAFLPFWFLFVAADVADPERILSLHGLVLVYTLFAAALGSWASLRERASLAAGGLAYGVLAGLVAGPPLLDLVFTIADLHDGLLVSVLSPPMVLALTFQPGLQPEAAAWVVQTSVALYLVGTAVLTSFAWRRLQVCPTEGPALRPQTVQAAGPLARLSENPILFRHALGAETRGQSRMARAVLRLVPPAVLAGPTLLAWYSSLFVIHDLDQSLTFGFYCTAFLTALYFCLGATGRGARAVAGERERKTLDALLGSRMEPGDLVRGLVAVAVGLPLLELLAWTPVLLGFTASGEVDLGHVMGLVGFTSILIVFCGSMGLWFSSRAEMALGAFRRAFGVLVVLVVGTFFADLLLHEVVGGRDLFLFTRANPVMGLASALGARMGSDGPLLWLSATLIYLLATWGFLRGTARRLGRGE